jgi:hypothetical protein
MRLKGHRLSLCLLTVSLASALSLTPTQAYAQACAHAPGSQVRCAYPGTACSEDGYKGQCRQLSDECECAFLNKYSIAGTVAGLPAGSTIPLRNNDAAVITASNGHFVFGARLPKGARYKVIAPAGCRVRNGEGEVASADVADIVIDCAQRQQGLDKLAAVQSALP